MQFVKGEWGDAPQVEQPAQPEKKMVAVLPFIEKELDQVEGFLKRSSQLCGVIPRTLYLLPFKGLDTKIWPESAFAQVGIIQDSEGKTSDWQGRERIRDAAGPNSLFRQAVWWFYTKKIGPWLWLEPDCWPIGDHWFQDIEREYFDSAKPFYGVKMTVPNGPEYMNGVGVYPWNAVQFATTLAQAAMWAEHPEFEVGFDVAGGKDVLSKAHITRKIQLVSHLARGNVDVRPETVLCHGRIDLTGGSVAGNAPDLGSGEREFESSSPDTFLGRYGAACKEQPKVLDEAPLAARHVPLHETPVQESPIEPQHWDPANPAHPSHDYLKRIESFQTKNGGGEYGGLSKEIRKAVEDLVGLWDQQPHRKVLIVKELRKAKLVPKHFR